MSSDLCIDVFWNFMPQNRASFSKLGRFFSIASFHTPYFTINIYLYCIENSIKCNRDEEKSGNLCLSQVCVRVRIVDCVNVRKQTVDEK